MRPDFQAEPLACRPRVNPTHIAADAMNPTKVLGHAGYAGGCVPGAAAFRGNPLEHRHIHFAEARGKRRSTSGRTAAVSRPRSANARSRRPAYRDRESPSSRVSLPPPGRLANRDPVAAASIIQLSCATRPFGSKAPIPGWPGERRSWGKVAAPKPAVPSSFGDGNAAGKFFPSIGKSDEPFLSKVFRLAE